MALDTANKRASSVLVGLPWRNLLPLPDATIDTGDRIQTGWLYRGIEPIVTAVVTSLGGRVGIRAYLSGFSGIKTYFEGRPGIRPQLDGKAGTR